MFLCVIQKSGKFAGISLAMPANYFMGKLDHLKNERSVKPKEIGGSIEEFAAAVDFNHNKCKYTSGVISFRDKENPTDAQKEIILKAFNLFLPSSLSFGNISVCPICSF